MFDFLITSTEVVAVIGVVGSAFAAWIGAFFNSRNYLKHEKERQEHEKNENDIEHNQQKIQVESTIFYTLKNELDIKEKKDVLDVLSVSFNNKENKYYLILSPNYINYNVCLTSYNNGLNFGIKSQIISPLNILMKIDIMKKNSGYGRVMNEYETHLFFNSLEKLEPIEFKNNFEQYKINGEIKKISALYTWIVNFKQILFPKIKKLDQEEKNIVNKQKILSALKQNKDKFKGKQYYIGARDRFYGIDFYHNENSITSFKKELELNDEEIKQLDLNIEEYRKTEKELKNDLENKNKIESEIKNEISHLEIEDKESFVDGKIWYRLYSCCVYYDLILSCKIVEYEYNSIVEYKKDNSNLKSVIDMIKRNYSNDEIKRVFVKYSSLE